MANPTGWQSAWGTYQAGVNDFSTVASNAAKAGDSATVEAANTARNAYIDSKNSTGTDAGSTKRDASYWADNYSTVLATAETNKNNSSNSGGSVVTGTGNTTANNTTANNTTASNTTANNNVQTNGGSQWSTQALGTYSAGTTDYSTVRDTYVKYAQAAANNGDYELASQYYTFADQANTARNAYIDEKVAAGATLNSNAGTTKDTTDYSALANTYAQWATQSKAQADKSEQEKADLQAQIDALKSEAGSFTSELTGNTYYYDTAEERSQYAATDLFLYQKQIEEQREEEVAAQEVAAATAATEQRVASLEAAQDEALDDTNEQIQALANRKAANRDNAALRLASAGDLGGIGQKQYSDEDSSYDEEYLTLWNEYEETSTQYDIEIANALYEGDIETANILADAKEESLNNLSTAAETLYNNTIANDTTAYEREVDERNYNYQVEQDALDREEAADETAYNRALQKLQWGTLDEDDMEALGLSETDAAYWANYYRTLADLDLAEAEADFASKFSGDSDDDSSSDSVAAIQKLVAAGIDPNDQTVVKNWLIANGLASAEYKATSIAAEYARLYGETDEDLGYTPLIKDEFATLLDYGYAPGTLTNDKAVQILTATGVGADTAQAIASEFNSSSIWYAQQVQLAHANGNFDNDTVRKSDGNLYLVLPDGSSDYTVSAAELMYDNGNLGAKLNSDGSITYVSK